MLIFKNLFATQILREFKFGTKKCKNLLVYQFTVTYICTYILKILVLEYIIAIPYG